MYIIVNLAELEAEIGELERRKEKANKYKAKLIEKRVKTETTVHTKIARYDLSLSDSIDHWAGKLCEVGESKKNDLRLGVHRFMSDINVVICTLDSVIRKIGNDIDAKRQELASL